MSLSLAINLPLPPPKKNALHIKLPTILSVCQFEIIARIETELDSRSGLS